MENFTDFVYSRLNRGLTQEKLFANNNLLHATLGLAGESFEAMKCITAEELTSELGDICFYVAILKRELGLHEWTIPTITDKVNFNAVRDLLDSSLELAELTKKYVFQERADLAEKIKARVLVCEDLLYESCRIFNLSVEDCIGKCVEKLTKRYPVEFTAEQSKNREV